MTPALVALPRRRLLLILIPILALIIAAAVRQDRAVEGTAHDYPSATR